MEPKKTYLIQRLRQPTGNAILPYSFGGNSGGLSDEALAKLTPIWTFDNMGSSGFELGAVPHSLDEIVNYSVSGNASKGKIILQKDVYYICHEDLATYVRTTIRQLARNESKLKLESSCLLKPSLENDEYCKNIVGWLELNNHFLFFTDETMYRRSLEMLGLKTIK
nr:hypothetical protein [Nanoarchaeum sp.]